MKVHLPDGTALDLPDGATGLDCARAIGERLAKAAAAIEVDGELRDLFAYLRTTQPLVGSETAATAAP